MSTSRLWSKSTVIFGGTALWGLFLVGCVVASRTVVAPPNVAGATYVGTKKCAECHEQITGHFNSATHANVALKDDKNVR